MYEPSIRLPLIIYDPRQPKADKGKAVSELTLNVDYGPTLLDLASVEVSAGMQGRRCTIVGCVINFAFAVKFFWLNLTTKQNPVNRS
jgi:hypothetical protein